MALNRRALAIFAEVRAVRTPARVGVELCFRLQRSRLEVDTIEDFADLGPEHCVPAVAGLGKVIRILRAARVAAPLERDSLLGREDVARALLEKAVGTPLALELRPRSRVHFVAWTEDAVERIDNVSEVVETPDAYLVMRRGGRFPARIPRESVIRQVTECERWYEVVGIERA